uniref:Cyclic nucleotide-binding domain-containing protein n=2 Tax=Guillardia theta TaxID=55529 RepID=A0A6U6BUJ7_GUITH|mmetsp:Transcript_40593/g.127994  ORF Transcript_40593/g.127994 Transcript_40593/m.127994 type:complete len:970 (+) Transcript_40593:122-3031(+)
MSANNSDSNSKDLDGSMGDADTGQDEAGGAGNNKYRRRNVERHLAAERDRRKATKSKLQELDALLPDSSSGPRTLNQCLKVAWEHINGIVKGKQAGGSQENSQAGERSVLSSAMEASPNVGVGVLNREWKFVRANQALTKAVSNGQPLLGVSLLSIVNPSDSQPLADLLSKLSRSTSNGGDKVFINIRFAARAGSALDFNRYYKLDIVSVNVRPNEKVQILLVYFGPSSRYPNVGPQPAPRPQGLSRAEELVNKIPILQGLDPMTLLEVLSMAQTAVLGPGTTIINAGYPPGPMFFLESGKCVVQVRGRQVAMLDAGDCFGEISLLSAEPRTADVITLTQSTVLQLPAVLFLQCAHSNPALMGRLQNLANSRLLRDSGSWSHSTGLPIGMGPALLGVPSRPMQSGGLQQLPQLPVKVEGSLQFQPGGAQPLSFGMQAQGGSFDVKATPEEAPMAQSKAAPSQLGAEPLSSSSSWSNSQSASLQPFGNQPEVSSEVTSQGLVSMIEAGSNWGGGVVRRSSGQVARQDSIIQLIGDIAGEASEPIAGPWASDFADGVLDGGRNNLHNRSRTATPDGAHRSMSWDSFVRGECDFSRHLAPASPTSSHKDGHGGRSEQPPITTERLTRCQMISSCSPSCIADMASRLRSVVAEEGDVLVHQGSPGRSLFFIEQGTCHVIVNGLVVRTLGPGECFGEISLIMTEMATAEVIAMEKCELLELPARDVWVLLPEYPDLYGLLKQQAIDNINRAGICDLSAWGDISPKTSPGREAFEKLLAVLEEPPDIKDLSSLLVPSLFCPFQTIVHAGSSGDSLFFIEHGSVSVINQDREVTRLGSGEFFGEVALMVSHQRTVDVQAITCVELLEIKGPHMWKLLNSSPRLYNLLIRKAMTSISNASGAFDAGFKPLSSSADSSKGGQTTTLDSLITGVMELDKILNEENDLDRAKSCVADLRPLLQMLMRSGYRPEPIAPDDT